MTILAAVLPIWALPVAEMAATPLAIVGGLLVGGACCVVARWLWKREEKETK